jgi:hypothetical protein
MLQRLAVDKDMPPEDEPEHELFRVNAAASFAEAKTYLETELKNMKGKYANRSPLRDPPC